MRYIIFIGIIILVWNFFFAKDTDNEQTKNVQQNTKQQVEKELELYNIGNWLDNGNIAFNVYEVRVDTCFENGLVVIFDMVYQNIGKETFRAGLISYDYWLDFVLYIDDYTYRTKDYLKPSDLRPLQKGKKTFSFDQIDSKIFDEYKYDMKLKVLINNNSAVYYAIRKWCYPFSCLNAGAWFGDDCFYESDFNSMPAIEDECGL